MRLLTLSLIVLLSYDQSAANVSFTRLDHALPGGSPYNTPYAVSGNGDVVVGTTGVPSPVSGNEAAIWTPVGGSVGLGDLTLSARGVSGDGRVVVGRSSPQLGNMGYRWTEQSGVTGLGYISGHDSSAAYAASYDANVIVGESHLIGGGEWHAFRWTTETGMLSIGMGEARDVSDDGSVIVGLSNDGGFRWTEATGQVVVGPTGALAVSADGEVVAGYGGFGAVGTHGWRWSINEGLIDIGDLPGGTNRSEVHAMSADGGLLVGSSEGPNGEVATIWDDVHGLRPITDMLRDDYGYILDGVVLYRAHGISDDGSVIVGFGYDVGESSSQFAWRLEVAGGTTIAGDLNGDGYVGIVDLNVILANWNQFVPPGDIRGDVGGVGGTGPDGYIGIDDLNVVLGNWNTGVPPFASGIHPVPEPATQLLLTAGALCSLGRRTI